MGFFSDLFGGASGKRASNDAAAAQSNAASAGFNEFKGYVEPAYASAQGRIDPFAQAGRKGFDLYSDSIGVNGAGGYGRAKQTFDADPFTAGSQASADRALRGQFNRYNAQGMGNSGQSRAAIARSSEDLYGQRVTDFRNRLMQMGQQGGQYAGQQAQWDIDKGTSLGNAGMNREMQQGNIEANRLMQGYQAQQQGMNNLMGGLGALGGFALKGFAPGAGGATAFGNMASGINKLWK